MRRVQTHHPMRMAAKVKAAIRGGPATLFDGRERWYWEERVRALGSAAIRDLQSEVTNGGQWAAKIDAEAFGDAYLAAVLHHLSRRALHDPYSAEQTINDELKQADADRAYTRRNLATTIRITTTKVLTVAVLGAGVVYGMRVGAPNAIPDWVEVGAIAAIATAVGATGTGIRKSQRTAIEAVVDATRENNRERLRNRLRPVVELLVGELEGTAGDPRAPPAEHEEQPGTLSERLETAYRLLDERVNEGTGFEVTLTLDDDARHALVNACAALLDEAKVQGLKRVDPICMEWMGVLSNAVLALTGDAADDHDRQIDFGTRFNEALAAASCVAVRLEPHPRDR
jgi:hypothetical protein